MHDTPLLYNSVRALFLAVSPFRRSGLSALPNGLGLQLGTFCLVHREAKVPGQLLEGLAADIRPDQAGTAQAEAGGPRLKTCNHQFD